MASIPLTSHHVNYLIWRYLQESGHGEAAVKLQRDWNTDPQSLPFASHIKTHALVTLIQKGLQLHELEQSIDKNGNPIASNPTMHFFGPESPAVANELALLHQSTSADSQPKPAASTNGITADVDSHQSTGPLPKRRKVNGVSPDDELNAQDAMELDVPSKPNSNGYERTETTSTHEDDAMTEGDQDVPIANLGSRQSQDLVVSSPDQAQDTEDEIQEEIIIIPTLINGQSIGIQVNPTVTVDLASEAVLVNAEETVLFLAWQPARPFSFALASSSTVSLWKSASPMTADGKPSYERVANLTELDKESKDMVTAISWNNTGSEFAIASYEESMGKITIFNQEGGVSATLLSIPNILVQLHWSKSDEYFVGVSSMDPEHGGLFFWRKSDRYGSLPVEATMEGLAYDTCWDCEDNLWTAGDHGVSQYSPGYNGMQLAKTHENANATGWHYITSAGGENAKGEPQGVEVVVCASADDSASIWCVSHDFSITNSHQGRITAIDLASPSLRTEHPLAVKNQSALLATASEDAVIKIWEVDPRNHRFVLTRIFDSNSNGNPAMSLRLAPDGTSLASSSKDEVIIWDPRRDYHGGKVARFDLDAYFSNGPFDKEMDSANRQLGWSHDGKKLAVSCGMQVIYRPFRHHFGLAHSLVNHLAPGLAALLMQSNLQGGVPSSEKHPRSEPCFETCETDFPGPKWRLDEMSAASPSPGTPPAPIQTGDFRSPGDGLSTATTGASTEKTQRLDEHPPQPSPQLAAPAQQGLVAPPMQRLLETQERSDDAPLGNDSMPTLHLASPFSWRCECQTTILAGQLGIFDRTCPPCCRELCLTYHSWMSTTHICPWKWKYAASLLDNCAAASPSMSLNFQWSRVTSSLFQRPYQSTLAWVLRERLIANHFEVQSLKMSLPLYNSLVLIEAASVFRVSFSTSLGWMCGGFPLSIKAITLPDLLHSAFPRQGTFCNMEGVILGYEPPLGHTIKVSEPVLDRTSAIDPSLFSGQQAYKTPASK